MAVTEHIETVLCPYLWNVSFPMNMLKNWDQSWASLLSSDLEDMSDKGKQTTYQNKPDSKSIFKPLQISVHAL